MNKWTLTTLGEVTTVIAGSTPRTSVVEYWNGEHNWITPAELKDTTFVIYGTERKITKKAIKDTSLKPLPIGTVLLSSRAPIGKVAIAGVEMYCNQGFKNLICSDNIYNKYLFWFLKGKTEFLNSLGRGATFKEISKTIVEKVQIPLPPLETQKQIAQTLDTAAELLAMRKQQLAELDNLIKSTFYEMFDEYTNDSKCYKLLTNICNFIDYRGKTPGKSVRGIPLITAKNIKKYSFSIEPQEYIPADTYEAVMTRGFPKINDVIFTTEAPLGNVCRIPNIFDKFAVGQRILVMQPFDNMVTSEYLEFSLRSDNFQKEMLKRSTGSTVRGIRSKELVQISIPIPPIELQTQFSTIVTKTEEQKALVKKAIDETQYLLDSLMAQYFE